MNNEKEVDKVQEILNSMGEIIGISEMNINDAASQYNSSVLVAKDGLLFFAWDCKRANT
jgi:hypothetical protein